MYSNHKLMNKTVLLFFISFLLFSCNDEASNGDHENIVAKNSQTFNLVNSIWNLKIPTISSEVQNEITNWNEWRQFTVEINQKPKSNLTAFQLKTKNLSAKVDSLQLHIPLVFDNPQVKSRMAALTTKIKLLDTFIHLSDVPQHKIKTLIPEINIEINALIGQWEEILLIKQIPKEVGEDFMIQALDTTRNANPKLMMEKMNKQDSISKSQQSRKNPFPYKK